MGTMEVAFSKCGIKSAAQTAEARYYAARGFVAFVAGILAFTRCQIARERAIKNELWWLRRERDYWIAMTVHAQRATGKTWIDIVDPKFCPIGWVETRGEVARCDARTRALKAELARL